MAGPYFLQIWGNFGAFSGNCGGLTNWRLGQTCCRIKGGGRKEQGKTEAGQEN